MQTRNLHRLRLKRQGWPLRPPLSLRWRGACGRRSPVLWIMLRCSKGGVMARDTILDAWCNGYAAAQDGAEGVENPYSQATKLAEVWARARQKSLNTRAHGLPAPALHIRLPLGIGHADK